MKKRLKRVLVENPAQSEAQRRYLNMTFGHDWVKAHHFDNRGPLPNNVSTRNQRRKRSLKVNRGKPLTNAKGRASPARLDPSKTLALRRQLLAQVRKKFAVLKGRIIKLVVDQDVFGLKSQGGTFSNVKNTPVMDRPSINIFTFNQDRLRLSWFHKDPEGDYWQDVETGFCYNSNPNHDELGRFASSATIANPEDRKKASDELLDRMGKMEDEGTDGTKEYNGLDVMYKAVAGNRGESPSLLYHEGKLVAAGSVSFDINGRSGSIEYIGSVQKGGGSAVMKHLLERLRKKGITEVHADASPDAIPLNKKFGFQVTGKLGPNGTPMRLILNENPNHDQLGRFASSPSSGVHEVKESDLLPEAHKGGVFGKLKAVYHAYEKLEEKLGLTGLYKGGRELASAVAKERGYSQQHVDRVGKVLGLVDGISRWTGNVPGVHTGLEVGTHALVHALGHAAEAALASVGGPVTVGLFAAAKIGFYLPVASLAYAAGHLAVGTVRGENPLKTIRGARERVRQARASKELLQSLGVNIKRSLVAELLEKWESLDKAVLCAALDETQGDLGESMRLASTLIANSFDESQHPRDYDGRFIAIGADVIVGTKDPKLWKVTEHHPSGKIRVEREGQKKLVDPNKTTVDVSLTKSPDTLQLPPRPAVVEVPKPIPITPVPPTPSSDDPWIDHKKIFGSVEKMEESNKYILNPKIKRELENGGGTKKEVDLKTLTPTQEYTGVGKVKSLMKDFDKSQADVSIIRANGKNYIFDGHHTAAAAILRGETSMRMRVYTVNLSSPQKEPTSNDREWQFSTDPEQVRRFKEWLRSQMGEVMLGKPDKDLWRRFAEAGWKKGAARSFDDVNGSKPYARGYAQDQSTQDIYRGGKEEFLRSSFNQPIAQERLEALAERSFTDLENVGTDMAARMGRTLMDGLAQGQSPHDVARDLSGDLDISRGRAETIARTEIIRAHAEGQLDALTNLGVEEVGVEVEWLATADSITCPDCAELEETVFSIEEAHGMIPRHPNCRCCFRPHLPDELTGNRGDRKMTWNSFCPTGQGGGVDPTCSPKSSKKNLISADTRIDRAVRLGADPARVKEMELLARRQTKLNKKIKDGTATDGEKQEAALIPGQWKAHWDILTIKQPTTLTTPAAVVIPPQPLKPLELPKSLEQLPTTISPVLPQDSEAKLLRKAELQLKRQSNLTPDQKEAFQGALERVIKAMPPGAQEKVLRGLKRLEFHSNTTEITRAYAERGGKVKVNMTINGFYNHRSKQATLNGVTDKDRAPGFQGDTTNIYGTYAHELGHAIDHNNRLSNSKGWREAYNTEIVSTPTSSPRLSNYAKTSPSEGFAEFSRLLYGSTADKKEAEKLFPKCFKYFRKKGLWE